MVLHGIDLGSPEIRAFCRKWKITELCVFGSILRDDFRTDSDIDFLAEFEEDVPWTLFDDFDMIDELTALLGREVDIVSRDGLRSSQNRFLKREINTTAERVYAA